MMEEQTNKVIELANRPDGIPNEDTFRFREISVPEIKEGEVLLKSLYVSVDPGMRGFMNDSDSYGQTFEIGEPVTSRTVAEVVRSQNPDFSSGDIVHGRLAWQIYQRANTDSLQKVDPERAPVSTAVGMLGVTGLAAYFGMTGIGNPAAGETVLVSGAAGAVGSTAAQIAGIMDCRVVGTAGSDQKVRYLEEELGIDRAINYKTAGNLKKALAGACPNGVDIYFDNVGGPISDQVMGLINRHARIVVCGQIALYNEEDQPMGPRPQQRLIQQSARMEGFVVFDFEEQFDEAKEQLARWYNSGRLKQRETISEGFDQIPAAFIGLFSGENIGKQLVKITGQKKN